MYEILGIHEICLEFYGLEIASVRNYSYAQVLMDNLVQKGIFNIYFLLDLLVVDPCSTFNAHKITHFRRYVLMTLKK